MSLAIITGASSGIGKEFAYQLKEKHGFDELWFVARSTAKMNEIADDLGVKVTVITADLTTKEGIEIYRERLLAERPEVDFLINCAGFGVFGSFDAVSEDTVCAMIDLNVKASVLITHMTVPFIKRGGRIIELGSGSCFTPLPHFNIYSSTKVFILHYTKSLNHELKPYGIRATCFCPGWVETPFLPKSLDAPGAYVPKKMKPLLKVEKVASGCVKASVKGKAMYVTNWYTKMQHMLFKWLPDPILTKIWLGMLKKNESTEKGEE